MNSKSKLKNINGEHVCILKAKLFVESILGRFSFSNESTKERQSDRTSLKRIKKWRVESNFSIKSNNKNCKIIIMQINAYFLELFSKRIKKIERIWSIWFLFIFRCFDFILMWEWERNDHYNESSIAFFRFLLTPLSFSFFFVCLFDWFNIKQTKNKS